MAKYKVYISSTYSDLKEYRQQVIEFFGKKTIKENFDLLSMEGYVADNVQPSLECMEDVKNCNIYILIFANRYGFIPPQKNPAEISITEIEYNTALQDPQKTILAFFADETDPHFIEDNDADTDLQAKKKQKLAAFKTRVREARITSPEPFVSAYQLALQISESLMRRSFIAYKLDNTRAYCCDRVPQFSRFLMSRTKGAFKAVIIYGNRKELGLNLINRVNIFALDLPEDAIQNQLVSFEDFLISTDYIQNRNSLLVYVFNKYFPSKNPVDIAVDSFLTSFKTLNTPLVFVINCDASLFEENQLVFLKSFMDELYRATVKQEGLQMYLFVNFEDNANSPALEQQLQQLQQLPDQVNYLSVLPKLQSLNTQLVKTWLINYITPNPGRAEEIMDTCFNNLSVPLSMYEADKKMHAFIAQVNDNNPALISIIN